jgi:enterochelin esterase-like enzyme
MKSIQLDLTDIQNYTRFNRRPRRSGYPNRIDGVFFWLLLLCFLIPACTVAADQPSTAYTEDTPVKPSMTVGTLSETPTPVATPTNVPTDTPIACLARGGTLETHEIRHPALVAPLRVRVYLPPCYEEDSYASYPTLILLHGLLATETQWGELGVDEQADDLIQSGSSPPFIMLMPWIRNSQDPQIAVMEALIPFAEERWRLSAERDYWAIGGLSRGAGQALQIGLLHPERFRAIGLHSPAILLTPELLVSWMLDIEDEQRPGIWLDIGEADSLRESTLNLLDQFQQAGIALTYQLNSGDHTSSYWQEHLTEYLEWYRSFWISSSAPPPSSSTR